MFPGPGGEGGFFQVRSGRVWLDAWWHKSATCVGMRPPDAGDSRCAHAAGRSWGLAAPRKPSFPAMGGRGIAVRKVCKPAFGHVRRLHSIVAPHLSRFKPTPCSYARPVATSRVQLAHRRGAACEPLLPHRPECHARFVLHPQQGPPQTSKAGTPNVPADNAQCRASRGSSHGSSHDCDRSHASGRRGPLTSPLAMHAHHHDYADE